MAQGAVLSVIGKGGALMQQVRAMQDGIRSERVAWEGKREQLEGRVASLLSDIRDMHKGMAEMAEAADIERMQMEERLESKVTSLLEEVKN